MSPSLMTSPSTRTWLRSDTAEAGALARATIAASTSESRMRIIGCSPVPRGLAHLVQSLEHLVGCLDDLGVHLVGALRGNQVGHLLHRVDVGGLEEALQRGGKTLLSCGAGDRVARGGRLQEEVVAGRLQAGVVGERRQLELANPCKRRFGRLFHEDLAVG